MTWSPPKNEDIAFYNITIANSEHSMSANISSHQYTTMLATHGSGVYNVTIIAENVCGFRSEAAMLTDSEVTCATCAAATQDSMCPECTLLLYIIFTGLLLVNGPSLWL